MSFFCQSCQTLIVQIQSLDPLQPQIYRESTLQLSVGQIELGVFEIIQHQKQRLSCPQNNATQGSVLTSKIRSVREKSTKTNWHKTPAKPLQISKPFQYQVPNWWKPLFEYCPDLKHESTAYTKTQNLFILFLELFCGHSQNTPR